MDDQTKHRASFPPPVFKSRVVRARILLDALGVRMVFDEAKGVVLVGDREAVKKYVEEEKKFSGRAGD